MILTIDIGNTNTVFGAYKDDKLLFISRISTDKNKMPDEYSIKINSILKYYKCDPSCFTGAIISSVVPPLLLTIKQAVENLIHCPVLTASPGVKTGLNIKIDNPASLGADLVCGAVAALRKYDLPCILLDMGTATKFSVLDENGCFLGVSILPGLGISLDALSRRTAQLPHISLENANSVIGTNTIDSMKSGIIFGTASMVDGMVDRITDELGLSAPPTVVATGGISPMIIPYCKNNILLDAHLILDGLYAIYQKNTKK